MNKSSEYWQQRFEQLEDSSHSCGLSVCRKIEPVFEQAQREIQKEIEAWYGRFAKSNEISVQEARKMLSASELKAFHWDVRDYIKCATENAVDSRWIKALENASANFHISRLEALKIRTQQAAEIAFGNELDAVDAMAKKVYADTYYHSIFEAQKGFNLGRETGQLDERRLEKIVSKPWAADGKNFADRIRQSKNQLISEVHNELTRSCILGKAPDEAIRHISKRLAVSKSQAERLVMTEEAYFHSAAQEEAFEELGVKEYEIRATLDSETSEICRSLNGKCFPMEEYSPGSTAPPFHPWCRTVVVPHFDDNDNFGTKRAAGDETEKTNYVPDDMTYKDWEQKYVVDAVSDADKAMFERYKGVLKELSPETIDDFIKIKYNNSAEWEQLKYQYRTLNQYKIDSGDLSAQEILDLDTRVISEKRNNFSRKFRTSGNIAGAYIDGSISDLYIAHSRINYADDITKAKYQGTSKLVELLPKRQFEYISVPDGYGGMRDTTYYDTEAKIFEWLASQYSEKSFKTVTILSERGMCDSCLSVMEQFKTKYGVTVNAVSNKKVNGNVWGKRWKRKK